ncbi:MAG TPA: GNAT family N-acetyltransferase [Candidatus Acidoferrales bacterium]|nr:GNAT family N-acetyltransferase [Candidatus Acidoferrales bacterium]
MRFRPFPRIALAQPQDAPALARLYSRAWGALGSRLGEDLLEEQVPSADDVRAWLLGGFEVYRASFDGRLAGAVRCSFPTGACLLDRLAVAPEWVRRGVGRALAEHALSRARRAGMTRVWAQLSPALREANALFTELGFRELAKAPPGRWGEDLLLLELRL